MPAAVESFVPLCTGPLITQSMGKILPQFKGQIAAFHDLRGAKVVFGNVASLSPRVRSYVEENVALCKPDAVHICDGSPAEGANLLKLMQSTGAIKALSKYDNCWLARTNPKDVARVESRTFICSDEPNDVVPNVVNGKSKLGNWISPKDYDNAVSERFPGCMKGRTMYVIPYSMGPVGSPLSKIGIECTDSAYVVYSMVIMTRVGVKILDLLKKDDADFVRCLHSVGTPANGIVEMPNWPCDPERTIILHKPRFNEIVSYGSGYGGNSLLGKKCFALRIGSTIAKREGWLAEHMVILGITNKEGEKRYMAAAFPSACGKTNLAMMLPSLPGFKLECVGDDIAWMKFDESGQLRAINPENGFFGVAPGTSNETNPNAMATIFKNTIFTNVAETSDGGVYWEGMSAPPKDVQIKDWLGKPWDIESSKTPAAHPNSRFCSPATQCPTIDPAWESSAGVPISAILFGGRRPQGVPLVYQARDWNHGVFLGASMRSETTAAAEFSGKAIMHDPFAMRPFFGYNFGHYISHWMSMADKTTVDKLPKIFHVNWFRKSKQGKFLWPGFGDNCRVLDWILRRCDGEECYQDSPIGLLPKENSINFEGLAERVNTEELFDIPKDFWLQEVDDIDKYFTEQVGEDLPSEIRQQLQELRSRLQNA